VSLYAHKSHKHSLVSRTRSGYPTEVAMLASSPEEPPCTSFQRTSFSEAATTRHQSKGCQVKRNITTSLQGYLDAFIKVSPTRITKDLDALGSCPVRTSIQLPTSGSTQIRVTFSSHCLSDPKDNKIHIVLASVTADSAAFSGFRTTMTRLGNSTSRRKLPHRKLLDLFHSLCPSTNQRSSPLCAGL